MNAAKAHLELLHSLPCVVTFLLLAEKKYGVVVHHLESVRDELSDFAAIPISVYWHSELHRLSRREFERKTKLTPIDLLAGTIQLIMEKQPTS